MTPSTASVVRSTTSTSIPPTSSRASSSCAVSGRPRGRRPRAPTGPWSRTGGRGSSDDASRAPSTGRAGGGTARATDSGRPHIGSTSTRPLRTSRTAISPSMPASSSSFSVPWTAGAAAAWPKLVGHQHPPVPVVARVGLRVAGDEVDARRRCSATRREAQVELEVGPVVGQRVDDLLECVGEAHRWAAYRAPNQRAGAGGGGAKIRSDVAPGQPASAGEARLEGRAIGDGAGIVAARLDHALVLPERIEPIGERSRKRKPGPRSTSVRSS